MDKVFPFATAEGIVIHDWDKWGRPIPLTMDAYWKYQGEKESFYAIIEAFAQNNGHPNVTDARYINAAQALHHPGRDAARADRPPRLRARRPAVHRPGRVRVLPDAVGRRAAPRPDRNPCHQPLQQVLQWLDARSTNHWFDNVWYLSVS